MKNKNAILYVKNDIEDSNACDEIGFNIKAYFYYTPKYTIYE